MPIREIACAVPRVAMIRKPRSWKRAASCVAAALSPSVTVMKTVPSREQGDARGGLRLPERGREVARDAHHLAGGLHLRAEHGVGAGEPCERQHRLLDRDVVGRRAGHVLVGQALAQHQAAGDLRERRADRLRDERDGPRGARVRLDDMELASGDRVLDVDQADHAELERDPRRGLADLLEHRLPEAHRRDHAGRVAGMDARLLDVLHDPGDGHLGAVAERVHVHLDGVLEEAVEQ